MGGVGELLAQSAEKVVLVDSEVPEQSDEVKLDWLIVKVVALEVPKANL